MTTVAARNGIMACDTMMRVSGNRLSFDGKIVRGTDFLLGMAGNVDPMIAVRKLLEGKPFEYLGTLEFQGEWHTLVGDLDSRDLSTLLMHKDKLYLLGLSHGSLIPCGIPFWAIGTGMDFAIGAMASGMSASVAVTIAATHDGDSGLPVRIEHLYPEL